MENESRGGLQWKMRRLKMFYGIIMICGLTVDLDQPMGCRVTTAIRPESQESCESRLETAKGFLEDIIPIGAYVSDGKCVELLVGKEA
jgi:hypothetical protein